MCIICVHYEQEKLTIPEALKLVTEYVGSEKIPQDHLEELNMRLCEDLQAQEEYYAIQLSQDEHPFTLDDELGVFDDQWFDFED